MDAVTAKIVLFASDLIDGVFEDVSEEGQEILDHAESCGLIGWRKPKASELADEEWWGHEYEIGADDAGVGHKTDAFIGKIKTAKAILAHASDERTLPGPEQVKA